jgi:putative two-component system response regulator
MGLNVREMEVLRYAGLLHDIGKIGIPELILLKDKRPSDDEFEIIKRHATLTRSILEKIRFPKKYNQIVEIASTHHERMNGRGYPLGLKGDDIPRGGKILAVCDVFDALTSRRPYEDRIAIKEVIHILDKETGESFEPFIVYHFKNITLDRIIQVMELGFSSGIEQDDLDFLKDYTLNDLVNMENIKSDDQQKLENTFLRYYSRQYRV